jgi:hypothetical protein
MPRPSAPAPLALILRAFAALALLSMALLPLAGLTGCERAPEAPVWDNPFDPLGPDEGDPLQLRAVVAGNIITLSWLQPQGMGLTEYAISRADHPDSAWTGLALVPHTTAINNIYLYNTPEPTRAHWFRIQALDASGQASAAAYATPAGVTLGPRVILNNGGATIASRFVTVKVIVSQGSDLRVALGPDYDNETTHPANAPGDTTFIALDTGAADQGDTIRVRVYATGDGYTSATSFARARVDFSPEFGLQGGVTSVASRTVTLAVPPTGVSQMRFASTAGGLAAAAWAPGAATHTEELLGPDTGAQEIWGEFAGDFGFSSTTHILVTPDLLTTAAFHLAVPADHVTATTAVRGILTGEATLLRWSEGPDLAAAPWQAHTDTLDITLSAAAGLKTIYVQMRNDWADSPILTDYAVLVSRGVEVAFTAPQAGAILPSGVPLQVRGTAFSGGAALDSVKVDLGDGLGFRAVTGLATWSYLWEVPVVEAEIGRTLRARAWAGTDSATVVAEVSVVP